MAANACTILIADDDAFVRDDLTDMLKGSGNRLTTAGTVEDAWNAVLEHRPDLVLLDLKFPDGDGLGLLKRIREQSPDTEVIIVSSQTENIPQVVEAIRLGAYDFVPKPFVREELRNRVDKALHLRHYRRSSSQLVDEAAARGNIDRLMGQSQVMALARETIRKLAAHDGPVLIRGESGTGKELAARALHFLSARRENPFVTVNCASIPEHLVESVFFGHRKGAFTGANETVKGRFESVEDGTLFLDEIGDMPPQQQAALLRVLEYRVFAPVGESRERECRARFVFATNHDLRELLREGKFREDLYYRINVGTVQLPPLRARPEDIPEIAHFYATHLARDMGRAPVTIRPEAMALLQKYDWPGNVRELRNVLEGAIMLLSNTAPELTVADLPPEILALRGATDEPTSVLTGSECREKQDLIRALRECGGNQTKAAKVLGFHRNTIRAKIRYFGITSLNDD